MKKSLYSILAVLTLGFAAFSCAPEEAAYEKGQPDLEGCFGVYFPAQESLGSLTFDPTMAPELSIEVLRSVSNGECDVPFEVSGDTEVFNFGTIHFEDGQPSTILEVSFDEAKIGQSYTVSIQITDPAYASKYLDGKIAADITVLRVEWKYLCEPDGTTPAKVTWIQNWWGEVHTGYVKYYEVDRGGDIGVLRTCQTVTDPLLYEEEDGSTYTGYGFWGTAASAADAVEWSFYWFPDHKRSDGSELIFIPRQSTGWYHANYKEFVYVMDDYCWNGEDYSLVGFLNYASENPNTVSYYDGNGGLNFYISTYYLFNAGGGWQPNSYDIIGIAEGYTRVDYSLEAEVDYCVQGTLPVYAKSGRDIKTIKLTVANGSLTSTEIKKIVNSIDELPETDVVVLEGEYDDEDDANYFGAGLSDLGATGTYTLVLAGLDASGAVQASTSLEVNYIAAEDVEEYAVEITVGTEQTSPRYDRYSDSDSFGFYICGKNIVAANVACVPTAAFEADPDGYASATKYNNFSNTDISLSAESVAQINRVGGYADVMVGLSALTSYTVIVWATNGNSDTIVTAEYTTSGLPNELLYEQGLYGYTIVMNQLFTEDGDDLFLDPLDVEYNPNNGGYEIPHWGADVTFKFSLDEETGEINVPLLYTGVSMPTYGDFYVTTPTNLDEDWTGYFESKGYDLSLKSYADESGYHFYVAYISTAGYLFGIDYEHYLFEMPEVWPGFEGEEEGEEAGTFSFDLESIQKSLQTYPAAGIKGYEREAKTVSVTVTPAERKPFAKEKGCNKPISTLKLDKKF